MTEVAYAADDAGQVRAPGGWRAVPVSDPVLASAITVPGVPGWAVQRPRITRQIADGVRWCQLTVVTGPAGAGKTTALASWAAAHPGIVAWMGLDGSSSQPAAFWTYVVAALRRSGVRVPARPGAGRGQAADRLFLLQLAAALATQDPPVTLVLDGLPALTEPAALDGLDYVLRNCGSGLRLAVGSRGVPPLPLHRYLLAGQLTEIRPGDLAFSSAEAGLLLARHGCALRAGSLEGLVRRTEGWAAGLRHAAADLSAHPDPDRFVTEPLTQHSAVTGYLVSEVLSAQPPAVLDVLLCTSILDQVSPDAAIDLTGSEQAAGMLAALARANTFIQLAESGYRYHPLFAEVLQLRLRAEQPDRVPVLHQQAARWFHRHGRLSDAVRHAACAGDWQLAASMVIGDLAISQILEPQEGQVLAVLFAGMPPGQAWTRPEPHLVAAAAALSAGRVESCAVELDAADGLLERLCPDQDPECRLAAALIRQVACLRRGEPVAASAMTSVDILVSKIPRDKLDRHPDIKTRLLWARVTAELWSGHLDAAARRLQAAVAAQPATLAEDQTAACLGQLALVEAIRGRIGRAAKLAAQAIAPAHGFRQAPVQTLAPAALVALAWVHLEHGELRQAASRLKRADAVLAGRPDALVEAVAYLIAAGGALAGGRPVMAAQIIARARDGHGCPAWLDHKLSLVESSASLAAGDFQAAVAAAERAGGDSTAEAAVTLAHAWAAAGRAGHVRRLLGPVLAPDSGAPEPVRVQAWLADARLGYATGDRVRGHRSLASALRLAEAEQIRLPFAVDRRWIGSALRRSPELAQIHRSLLGPALYPGQHRARTGTVEHAPERAAEPLTVREREILRHVSTPLSYTEIADELHISLNTVKTHMKTIFRKLGVGRSRDAVRRGRQLGLI